MLQQQCIYLPDVVRCRSGSTPCYMPTRIGGNPAQADSASRLGFAAPDHVRFYCGRLTPPGGLTRCQDMAIAHQEGRR